MKIICIGRNYKAHAEELGNAVPEDPMIFMKPPTALLVSHKPLYYPDFTSDLQYECELVIKISKNGKHIVQEFAHRYYEEMAVGIDFTARDIQSRLKAKGHPWEIAKGFDSSAAVSEFIPIEDRHRTNGILFSMKKNGEIVQRGDTNNLIFSIDFLISYISKFFKLQMGDYIYTGTPAGVGPVVIGDRLEASIEDQELLICEIK
jgi:2-keto-4-pentenoate hydratase/2-oxohepta-3-ene-1,7-dioic acid hydratase in catechol pathway